MTTASPARRTRPAESAIAGAIAARHPAVGLAIGVVRDGRLSEFSGHGLADIGSHAGVTPDTVFRIASVTKLFTAVAVMQLVEHGQLDLDAPANESLRAYRLVPARAGHQPVTIRHLLTHTSGVPDVVHLGDILHPGRGSFESRPAAMSVPAGEPLPALATYYAGGLRSAIEPGTAFAYSNHGFATLGQIVEDVTGLTLDRYLRAHVFDPLGMADTDLIRSERLRRRLATGYQVGRHGPIPVPDRDWITRGASSIFSTTGDLGRFAAALLAGGVGEGGRILSAESVALMFAPHHQPDPRLPGMGLGFFRFDARGHLLVGHDGRMPGFNADLLLAPHDGLAVIGLTNGSPGAMAWLPIELDRLLRERIGASEDVIRSDLPHRPETWSELVGTYGLPPRVSHLRERALLGGGVEVLVRGGRLTARLRVPVPALWRGVPLHPDDESDPYVHRMDLAALGLPSVRVAFDPRGPGGRAMHTDLACLSLVEIPRGGPGRRAIAIGALLAGCAVLSARRRRPG